MDSALVLLRAHAGRAGQAKQPALHIDLSWPSYRPTRRHSNHRIPASS